MLAVLTGSVLTVACASRAAPLLPAGALVTNFFQVSAGASFGPETVDPYIRSLVVTTPPQP